MGTDGAAKGLAVGGCLSRLVRRVRVRRPPRASSNAPGSGSGTGRGPRRGDSWTQRWGFGGAEPALERRPRGRRADGVVLMKRLALPPVFGENRQRLILSFLKIELTPGVL